MKVDFSYTPRRLSENGFFDEYLSYARHQESPEDFHLWVAINMISTVLGRKCYLDRGYYKIYPNTYVVLVGESAKVHKSTSINMGKDILRAANNNLHFFSQKGTSEGLRNYLHNLSESEGKACCNITIPEFATFFGKSTVDPSLMHDITDFYDCPDHRSYTTISRGIEEVSNIGLNMMAGSTIEWLRSCVPTEDLGGGFIARLLMVHRDEVIKEVPFPEDSIGDPEVTASRERCVNDLQAMSAIEGPFTWTNSGKSYFLSWYEEFKKNEAPIPIMRGYYGRKDTTLIKLAMVSSASKSSSRQIDEDDIMLAVEWLADNEESMLKVSEGLGQTEVGRRLDYIMMLITKESPMPHSVLLNRVSHQMTGRELGEAIDTLKASRRIISATVRGRRVYMHNLKE